jgi:alkylation response protein AidB-like acyl-CoA dehydrogenase
VNGVRLSDSRSEARFRAELTAWLDDNQPAADRAADLPRSPGHIPGWARDWQLTLFDAGWLVPRWPAELGGRDASAVEQMIYLEELARRRVPRTVNLQGLDVCAPTVADHGSDAQQAEWLLPTLRGELAWCVAVDEAGAPPPVETDAPAVARPPGISVVDDGGTLTLNGSVPAPDGVADADRCLCGLTVHQPGERVDGVAVVALDLSLEGVSRIGDDGGTMMLGGVRVDASAVIGERDQGWPVLQSVRARQRSVRWITSLLATQRAIGALADVGRARGLADDGVFRDTLAGLQVEADAVRALAYRALAKQSTGRPNPELGMLPMATTTIEERVYLAGLEVLGADGLDMGLDGPRGWPSGSWATEWTATAAASTASGGLAAERDRVAARVLGLRVR